MKRRNEGKSIAKGPERTTAGGGGAAMSAGFRFQQQVGAVIGGLLLAERPFDQRFDLGQAKPEWIRFETEAPVDDMLVGTSDGGFVAFQMKTNASLSKNLSSPFGKTIAQFVQHWLECRDGDGTLTWNRPLNAQVDRLVFAVGPRTSAKVREVLPTALRLKSQPGGGQLNVEQQRAFSCFEACVQEAWAKATADAYSSAVAQSLAALIKVLTFDPDGPEREATIATLNDVAQEQGDARKVLSGLETVCGELMEQRSGIDRPTARRKLLGQGIALQAPPDFRSDIDRLKAHSNSTAETLRQYEVIDAADNEPISIDRECQGAIRDAALGGSLLILGEPGAGKSGVLNALAREFSDKGNDVLELAVDSYSVETLEGLKSELGLEHGLVETLEAWDGTEPAWLVIDGLDASRGGHGAGVFRTLIERVMAHSERWKVIASIRTFDLRMGQKFQGLFKGTPPNEDLKEQEFPNVRHVMVPSWTPTEFAQLLDRVPSLAAVMTNAPRRLKDVASVPFNTRLLCELVKDGLVTADLSHVESQAELLKLYWKHRIKDHGASARACILRVVKSMVQKRVLRAPFEVAAENDATVLDVLERAGVLISVDNGRWIQFRHHLLFDFAAAQVLLDPEELISGRQKFSKTEAHGLMLAPALTFVLREIWKLDPSRANFWTAAAHVLSDREGDPIIRSATSRICAEYPVLNKDMAFLAERIVAGDENSAQAFTQISGAFGIRLEDHPKMPLEPWIGLVRDIAPNVAPVSGALRFLLFRLVEGVDDRIGLRDLGTAARALLAHAFSPDGPQSLVRSAISLVGDTYSSDVPQSRALLAKIFAPDRLEVHAAEEVPTLCWKIGKIAEVDPEFGACIYRRTYGFDVNDAQETNMGNSQILPLRSNTRQDYGMARHALKEFVGTFLELHPVHAVDAIVQAVEAYVEKAHAPSSEMLDVERQVGDLSVRLREDRSHVWAHDPETDYGDDAETLIIELLKHLRSSDAATAIRIAEELVKTSSFAIFWSRLFLAAGGRQDSLLDLCLPVAMQEEFLTSPDTRKDAVDVVAKGYERLSPSEREAFEEAVPRFDFSRFPDPDDARTSFERRLFGEIGETNLKTEHALSVAKSLAGVEGVKNERIYEFRMTESSPEPYHWIRDSDRESPANMKLIAAIDRTKGMLELNADADNGNPITLESSLEVMEALVEKIDCGKQHSNLIVHAEGQISGCIRRLVNQKQIPAVDDDATTARFLALFHVAVDSEGPVLHRDTEANFERNVAWGAPAPRVDAAEAALHLLLQRPDLRSDLEPSIDRLLTDTHPAVRLEAALNLVRIWDLDRAGFWQRLSVRLADETNLGVVDHICTSVLGRTVHADAEQTEQLIFALLDRFECEPERRARLRERLSDLIAILWVTYERQDSHAVLESWIADALAHCSELSKILGTLRSAFVAGLTVPAEPQKMGFRHRAQAIASRIVDAANAGLASHFQTEEPSPEQEEIGRNHARLLHAVCLQLHFAAKSVRDDSDPDDAIDGGELKVFLEEVGGTLKAIGDVATPSTVHYLLQLCELLLPVNPARAFDVAVHCMLSGGQRTGYQFESLGADLFVKLVGRCLADHNELFEDEDRRNALIECLEIFMNAGWPSAQRLLYRLPELIQ